MNAILKALDDVKRSIPRAILEATFIPYNGYRDYKLTTNIDESIRENVIQSRVLYDCNLMGGEQTVVPLEGLAMEKPSNWETIVRVPKKRTQGKKINSVLNVAFISPTAVTSLNNVLPYYGTNDMTGALLQAGQTLLSSFDSIPIVSTAKCQLIGENVILIRENVILSNTSFLRCILDNDEELSNIQLRSYPVFSQLVDYAVKSHIYNNLVISIDQGRLQAGYELGAFKDIVMGYSDAEQNYRDFLKDTWGAVAIMNDDTTYLRYMKTMLGSGK